TRPVDMHTLAGTIEQHLDELPHPALADAAAGYADFLRRLGVERDPLDRRVLVTHRAGGHAEPLSALRHAERTARALTGLGPAALTWPCTSTRSRPIRRPGSCAGSGRGWSPAAASTPTTASSATRRWTRPPTTPPSWPTGSSAARRNCSVPASTSPCTPPAK